MSLLNKLILIVVNTAKSTIGKPKKLSDLELVQEIVSTNNTLFFSKLYDRYSRKVYNKCYSFSRNEEEAKDLTQEVFLKLYTKLSTFQGKSKFSTWLYSFTYNFCANYVNRDKGRKMSDASDTWDNHDYYLSEMEDIEEDDLFEMKAAKLKKALEQISPEDKALLLLKYQDDISVKDLQKVLKIGESAVKMRLKRARIRVVEEHDKLK
ncbi:RNA polymerase sigma factor [Croceitalea sp. MTPC5]|uniref:RNA polymerase sigma factor n=1 Tax=Croceitalea sp. MTPC5 TaxID=3056565 RepID=UPI002B3777FC|nr:RNA polymerase sigma factor [Croceitalea sp. MTPC5]